MTGRLTGRLTRRQWFGAASAGAGVLLTQSCASPELPPDFKTLFGPSNAVTFAAQRLLLGGQPLVREFRRDQISRAFPAIYTVQPKGVEYQRLLDGHFRDWRLPVVGLLNRPLSLSLRDLQELPARTQITQHRCEQGWSAIAEWTGVPLAHVLGLAQPQPACRYVLFECQDGWWDSLDLFDALHPQTILAYAMNGDTLPVRHGAPLRLRVERQLGYKSLKYLSRIRLVDRLDKIGNGLGSRLAQHYAWYGGM